MSLGLEVSRLRVRSGESCASGRVRSDGKGLTSLYPGRDDRGSPRGETASWMPSAILDGEEGGWV